MNEAPTHCDHCMGDIKRPRKGRRYCSDACRAAHWRTLHEPRCWNCGKPQMIVLKDPAEAHQSRSVRQEVASSG